MQSVGMAPNGVIYLHTRGSVRADLLHGPANKTYAGPSRTRGHASLPAAPLLEELQNKKALTDLAFEVSVCSIHIQYSR